MVQNHFLFSNMGDNIFKPVAFSVSETYASEITFYNVR